MSAARREGGGLGARAPNSVYKFTSAPASTVCHASLFVLQLLREKIERDTYSGMEKKSSSAEEEGVKMHTYGRINHAPSTDVSGDVFSFKGGSTGCVMIMETLSPMFNYYEYIILAKGAEASIGIGIGERGYPLHRMPGWNRNSIGYHGDDGKLYHESGGGRGFGPTCTDGDRVGCGIDFDQDITDGYCEVFFTKNGELVGEPVRMKRPLYGLYPIIGLHSRGEKVRYLGHWHRQRQSLLEPMVLDHSPSNVWLRSNGVQFLEDGMTLEYCGLGGESQDPTLAQAKFPLNKTNHYFELVILSSGSVGAIAIGLGKPSYPLHTHPGWSHGAVGYHADDGKLFVERGMGVDFGPSCSEGDRMGCGILFDVLEEDKKEEEEGGREDRGGEAEGRDEGGLGEDSDEIDEDDLLSYGDEDDDYMNSDEDEYEDAAVLQMLGGGPPRGLRPPLFGMGLGRRPEPNQILARHNAAQRRAMALRHFGGMGGLRVPKIGDILGQRLPPKDSLTMDNSSSNCMVFFTKNGEMIGKTKVSMPKGGLYPIVGMLSKGEKVQVDLQPLTG